MASPCVVAGTGYTGEDGVELAVPAEAPPRVWDAVLGRRGRRRPGLGARDTLRLEAGLPLHGHELGPGITPLQAGLGWVVGWDKGDFRGRAALEAERERGVARRLRGLAVEGRRPPRADQPGAGRRQAGRRGHQRQLLARCSSHGIALAFLPPDVEEGARVEVDVRGTPCPPGCAKLPFYHPGS